MANIRLEILVFWIINVLFTESQSPAATLSDFDKNLFGTITKKDLVDEFMRLRQVEQRFAVVRLKEVGKDFSCAMQKIKDGFSNFLKFNGVKLIKCYPNETWNPRVLQIRIENDRIAEKPRMMYRDLHNGYGNVVHGKDNVTMCQWLSFVQRNLERDDFIKFHPDTYIIEHFNGDRKFRDRRNDLDFKIEEVITAFNGIGVSLRKNLDDYYANLDHTTRCTRYPMGKDDLYSYFAGVMVRLYRLACYYAHTLHPVIVNCLQHTYRNGTKYFLSTALTESMSTWYIDQEELDMLNVVLRTQGFTHESELFFVSKNIINGNGQKVVIPGYADCGLEPR